MNFLLWACKNGILLLNAVVLVIFGFLPRAPAEPKPLWPGAHYNQQNRDVAIERGLRFIYKIASNPKYFSRWGHDLLFCFYSISNTAKNEKLREMARSMGQERARQWRREHPEPPAQDPDDLQVFVYGAQAADNLLGAFDPAIQRRAQKAARHFSAIDFLRFDPRREPPPDDIPERCPKCDDQNPRGATICRRDRTPLTFHSSYDIWLDALITTHAGDAYGVKLGASYPEVLQWISKMRPYPAPAKTEDEFNDVSYAVTHVIYTLNDYHQYRLSRAWLPEEFSYLKNNFVQAERYEDWELLGEFMDALRAFGEDESDPEIQTGMDDLLSHQNPDGSWGTMDDDDVYTRYHATWTAIDGLREYQFHGEQLRAPELLPLLQGKTFPRNSTASPVTAPAKNARGLIAECYFRSECL